MCLAIVMYVVTGALSIIQYVLSMIGVFLLTLLGRAILLVGHTVSRDRTPRRRRVINEQELYTDSEDDRTRSTRSETSLKSRHSSRTIRPAGAQRSESTHETSTSI
ncbi:hypothetical protein ALC56_14567 [Trachymyrmex septentrionalis]|uniref:Uncharacterized protein n=1 Tax=Trachymyrmex septentrionalis TaxID=34720 RepID=A0A195ERF0_9HYME|nr:hypothetical protein ALC56_14567 [Trachymyrmex septentrionalis]